MDFDRIRRFLFALVLCTALEVHNAAGIVSEQQCLDSVPCGNNVDCRRVENYEVSRICFNGAAAVSSCEQHSICATTNNSINLHLSLRFSSALLSAPCRLRLSDGAGRRLYNFTSDNPGATGMYLTDAVTGSNVTVEYQCEDVPAVSRGTSAITSLRLQADYYIEPRSALLCRARPAAAFPCDYGSGCVPASWHCNGLAECKDGLDEYDCPTLKTPRDKPSAASPDSPACVGPGCSSMSSRDCAADQTGCSSKSESSLSPSAACNTRNATFRCVESGYCIPAAWRCDQSLDCSDSSDESDCDGTSVRVITAAVIGSLVCAVLIVIAAGCTCKLYTLRMMQEQRRSRRSRRYEMPMSAFHAELLRRRAPPPSYEASMQSPSSSPFAVAAATDPNMLPAAAVGQQQQALPLGGVQHELLAHIEAVAAAVRTQHASAPSRQQDRHAHHHHHHIHRHRRLHPAATRSQPLPTVSSSEARTSTDGCVPPPAATVNSCRDGACTLASLDRQAVDSSNRTRCRLPAFSTAGGIQLVPTMEMTVAGSTSDNLSPTSSLASLGSEGSHEGEANSAYERARLAAVREQLDQFLPTLPSFRCSAAAGGRGCRSRAAVAASTSQAMPAVATLAATVDNVRITAAVTASYRGHDGCGGESSTGGCFGIAGGPCVGGDTMHGASPAGFSSKKRPLQRLPATDAAATMDMGGFGSSGLSVAQRPRQWQPQQQRLSRNAVVALTQASDDDEPLLLASGNSSSTSSSGSTTPSSEQLAVNAAGFASPAPPDAAAQLTPAVNAAAVTTSTALPITAMGTAMLSLAAEVQPSGLVVAPAADSLLCSPAAAGCPERAVPAVAATSAATTTFASGISDLHTAEFAGRGGCLPQSES